MFGCILNISLLVALFWRRDFQKHPPEFFYEKDVLKDFAKFKGKQLCWSHFLIKLQAWTNATLLKRDSYLTFFPWILQNFQEHRFYLRATASGFWGWDVRTFITKNWEPIMKNQLKKFFLITVFRSQNCRCYIRSNK